jgi:hypothetical protein
MLSRSDAGRPARVKWRYGTEIGAEFVTTKSATGARKVASEHVREGQKSERLLLAQNMRRSFAPSSTSSQNRCMVGNLLR